MFGSYISFSGGMIVLLTTSDVSSACPRNPLGRLCDLFDKLGVVSSWFQAQILLVILGLSTSIFCGCRCSQVGCFERCLALKGWDFHSRPA